MKTFAVAFILAVFHATHGFAEQPIPAAPQVTPGNVAEHAVAPSAPKQVDGYDDLNSFPNGRPTLVRLKPEEAAWLRKMIAEGKLRLATEADKKAWEAVAKQKNRRIQTLKMDMGRTYVIIEPIEIPSKFPSGSGLTGNVTFIVSPGVQMPRTRAGSTFYDIGSGGWYSTGSYDDGEKEGRGRWPHETSK